MGIRWGWARLGAGAAAMLWSSLALSAPSPGSFPTWAYPPLGHPSAASGPDVGTPRHVPGSARAFTADQADNPFAPPDWFPERHPAAPPVVRAGQGTMWACGYCHLPDGSGRPENATLAGLPAAYIREQVAAFRSGERKAADPHWSPSHRMADVAAQVAGAEVDAAADYFAALSYRGHVRVKEADRVPAVVAEGFLLKVAPGPGEPLGDRIVEGPASSERFELRDPTLIYTALAPRGSLARGAALARTGTAGLPSPCVTCHGANLRGGAGAAGPPLAGRSPSYLFRQLYAFQTGARGGPAAAPMRLVTNGLAQSDMIALAAHAASQRP